MGAEAKLYLQEHRIPQLFEGLMTGLIYNRPQDPISFLEQSLQHIKAHPTDELTWDMFIEKGISTSDRKNIATKRVVTRPISKDVKSPDLEEKRVSRESKESRGGGERTSSSSDRMGLTRTPSVIKAAQVAEIPQVPIILFMGGPGGGKTRHAAKVASALEDKGLVHICMPDIIRQALARYKDKYPEWRDANEHYLRGELIPNHLALALVKAEMGRHKNATAFFLEGFPREARQVEDFERQVKSVNMALIIDYDEKTLRDHMEKRGLGMEIIDQKIKEFKQKTLPSAKYFDDQKLLHLIPGERDDQTIYDRMKTLVAKAMDTGIPVINSNPPSQHAQRAAENAENEPGPIVESAATAEPSSIELLPPKTTTPPEAAKVPTRPPTGTVKVLSRPPTAVKVETPPLLTKPPSPVKPSPPATAPSLVKPATPVTSPEAVAKPPTPSVPPQEAPVISEQASMPISPTPHAAPASERQKTPKEEMHEEHAAARAAAPSLGALPRPPSAEVRVIPPTAEPPATITTTATVHNSRPPSTHSRKPTANGEARTTRTATPKRNDTPTKEEVPRTSSSPFNLAEVPRGLPNNAPVILLVGAPGALKNDVAKRIIQKYDGFVLLSMGELLRKSVGDQPDDELWKRVNSKIEEGEPVPTKLCRQLLYTEIHQVGQGAWGYVVEGFPRTMSQLEDFETVVARLDVAILIDCTEQFCEEVVKKRYEESGNRRKDDSPEVFKTRLASFKQNTLPMLKNLDERGKLKVVDGDGDADTVFKDVSQVIDGALFIEEDDGSGGSLDESKKGSLNATQ